MVQVRGLLLTKEQQGNTLDYFLALAFAFLVFQAFLAAATRFGSFFAGFFAAGFFTAGFFEAGFFALVDFLTLALFM